jgi:hypothetical protein
MADELIPTLPGMEGALPNPLDEAQARSEMARQIFETSYGAEPWMDEYFTLVGEGWSWRQAVYILWSAQPKDKRVPRTQGELAVQVLGLLSDRTIRDWKAENPTIETRIRQAALKTLQHARADVINALVESAKDPSYRHHNDRKLFLEMTGDYVPKQAIGLAPLQPGDLRDASTDTLQALAGVPKESHDDES